MSYLDVPRIHFAGKFFANPSTVDNVPTNYDPVNTIRPEWNPLGFHHFRLEACKVTAAVLDASGALKIAHTDDSIIGGSVELSSSLPVPPKLVDLDTEWQSSSQIWGMKLAISNGADAIEGSLDTATLRDLWFARVPSAAGLAAPSGSFQSILRDLKYGPSAAPGSSAVLNQFIGAGVLAIRFISYVYDTTSNTGKVVGTIGVADPTAAQFLNARRMEPAAAVNPGFGPRIYVGNPYGPAPFKLDEARKRLIIDLGNSIPETSVAGARASKGVMKVLVTPTGKSDITIGTLDYTQAHYEITAGVEELPVTDAQIAVVKSAPVKITLDKPATQVVLSERPTGSNLEAAETVLRMDPGDTATIDLFATQFGQPKSGQLVSARLTTGGNRTAAGLAFTVLGGGKTDPKGKVQIKFTASDPGKVRAASKIDGQLYFVEVDWGRTKKGVAPDWRGRILVKVFDSHAAVAKPKWADVQDIFQEYARMYPGMKGILDLGSQVLVQGSKDRIKATLSYPITDPRYMPVSRDLSRDKKDLILRWIAAGAP